MYWLLWSVYQQYPLKLTPFSKCKSMPWQTTHLWNSLGHWIINSCQWRKAWIYIYWMVSISMGIVDTHSIEANTLLLMYREPKCAHFWKSLFEKKLLLKNYKEMKDQINASKILHSSAIYIQSMKITRPLCKKLLTIKSVICFFLHLVYVVCFVAEDLDE